MYIYCIERKLFVDVNLPHYSIYSARATLIVSWKSWNPSLGGGGGVNI